MSNSNKSESSTLKDWIDRRQSGLRKLLEDENKNALTEHSIKFLQTRWSILESLIPEKILLVQFSGVELTWIQLSLEERNYVNGTKDMSDGEKNIMHWLESKIPLWVASYVLQLSQAKLTHSQK